jgi:hypothetical protein
VDHRSTPQPSEAKVANEEEQGTTLRRSSGIIRLEWRTVHPFRHSLGRAAGANHSGPQVRWPKDAKQIAFGNTRRDRFVVLIRELFFVSERAVTKKNLAVKVLWKIIHQIKGFTLLIQIISFNFADIIRTSKI